MFKGMCLVSIAAEYITTILVIYTNTHLLTEHSGGRNPGHSVAEFSAQGLTELKSVKTIILLWDF